MDHILAWHFLPASGRTRHSDEPVAVGQTLVYAGKPILCEQGYHASRRIIDALRYAPGPILCRVRMGGTILEANDKFVATERTVLAMADISTILHEFACWYAESVIHHIPESDRAPFVAAIEAKRAWLRGDIGDAELAAARSASGAARSAAWSAAWSAAESAARSASGAAWSAAGAAWSAAESAAWSAAESAAWSAAWSAAESAAWSAAGSAAGAAWSAAGAEAGDDQEERILEMVSQAMEI